MRLIYTIIFIFLIPQIAISQEKDIDYYSIEINTGDKPECVSCNARYELNLDNYLSIDASGATDVVVKIINSNTDECIRCVFISGGSRYEIANIPEGVYYLKIAYGYDWSKKVSGGYCFAKFLRDAHYQIGNDLLDYYLKKSDLGLQVPSYELELRVISNNLKNEFESDNISEEEFYK